MLADSSGWQCQARSWHCSSHCSWGSHSLQQSPHQQDYRTRWPLIQLQQLSHQMSHLTIRGTNTDRVKDRAPVRVDPMARAQAGETAPPPRRAPAPPPPPAWWVQVLRSLPARPNLDPPHPPPPRPAAFPSLGPSPPPPPRCRPSPAPALPLPGERVGWSSP